MCETSRDSPISEGSCPSAHPNDEVAKLPPHDFRRERQYLPPSAWGCIEGDITDIYGPPQDLVLEEIWRGVMDLPTDVALESTSQEGSRIARLHRLHSDWIFSWPEEDEAPFVEMPTLLAGEEFDALVFNAVHGWYRQALGCLRNALEILTVSAGLAVRNDRRIFDEWRAGTREVKFGNAREFLRDSTDGKQIDTQAAPQSIFGTHRRRWVKCRYSKLCSYAHSVAGYNNADFWESNGPLFVPRALALVESELRETLALCYLLVRLSWPNYRVGPGQPALLTGPRGEWAIYGGVLEHWLLPRQP